MITIRALYQLKQNLPEGYGLRIVAVHDGRGVSGTVIDVESKVTVRTDDGRTVEGIAPWNITSLDMVHEQEDNQSLTSADFQIVIKADNDASDRNGEIAAILRNVATKLDKDMPAGIIRNLNGDTVGAYSFRADLLP